MPYPRRGAWAFTNVKQGFTFTPTLDTIEVTQEYPDMVATFACEVVDQDEGWDFDAEDEVRVTFDGERIFAGHIKTVTEDRVEEFGPRKWVLEAQDYTAKLGDAIIRTRQHRREESAGNRLRWIISFLGNAWHIDGRDFEIPDERVERQDMFGMTVAEALDSFCNEVGGRYWIDLDNVLHVHKESTIPAPFGLDNEAPDLATTFPFREFTYRRDSVELSNAILVEPEKRSDSRWSVSHENIALYEWGDSTGRQESFIAAEEIRTARGASRHGDAQLQRTKFQEQEATLVCFEPGLWAGMSVVIHEALWEHDQTLRIVNVVVTALDPHDDAGQAYLKSELTLTNKPKRRSPKMGRPEERTSNVASFPVDGFDRVVTPAAPVEGDAFTPTLSHNRLSWEMVGSWSEAFGPGIYYPETPTTPVLAGVSAASASAWDVIPAQNTSWPYVPCGIGLGAYHGWREHEHWASFVVPAHPVDMAGIYLTVSVGSLIGLAVGTGVLVRAQSTTPVALRAGTVVGPVNPSGEVFIPGALVPAAGQTMWIGVTAGWSAPHDYGFYCAHSPPVPYPTGKAEAITFSGWKWATASSSLDLGSNDAPAGAPWQGAGTWEVAGIEGAGTFGMDGDAFYLTSEAPAGVGISLPGPGEDEENPTQAFDGPWGVEVEFEVDSLGDTGAAGTRSIELTTTGESTQTVGTIHLGDMSNPTGVTVAGPTSTANAGVTLTANERYRASFDTRSGELVAKIWRVSDGEPAGVVALGPLDVTEDMGDRLTLWLRAGNGVGEEQTVRVTHIDGMAVASPGSSIVYEWIGFASGDVDRFRSRHRHLLGTLVAYVNGIASDPVWADGIEFRLDTFPTAQSGIHASYIVAEEVQE
jgi:hypothetical protein